MKPVDLRNAQFSQLKEQLTGLRKTVWRAWLAHGPGTTREVAARSGIDILTFRPRSSELFQLRVLELTYHFGHEGVYCAKTLEQWEAWFNSNPDLIPVGQIQMF